MKPTLQLENPVTLGRRSILAICFSFLICCIKPYDVSAQEQLTQPSAQKMSPGEWLRRTFKRTPSTPSGSNQSSKPMELKVIDRETARRLAMEDNTARSSNGMQSQTNSDTFEREQLNANEHQKSSQHDVQAASYQQPQPRVYNSPPYNPNQVITDANGYPSSANPLRFGQTGMNPQQYYQEPFVAAPDAFQQPQFQQPQFQQPQFQQYPEPQFQESEVQTDRQLNGSGMIRPETQRPTQNFPIQPEPGASGMGMSAVPQNSALQEQFLNQEPHPPAEAGPGSRGYLQNGPVFHGRHLNASQQTATERAMFLQNENNRLRKSVDRKHQELLTKNRALEDSQLVVEQKNEELRQSLDRLAALNREVTRLNGELNRQIELRLSMEKRMNDQLQSIETMLDGVLLNSMSEARPTAIRK